MTKRKHPYVPPILTPVLTEEELAAFIATYNKLMEAAPVVAEVYERSIGARSIMKDVARADHLRPDTAWPTDGTLERPGLGFGRLELEDGYDGPEVARRDVIPAYFFTDPEAPQKEHEAQEQMIAENARRQQEAEAQWRREAEEHERREYARLARKYGRSK